LWHAAAILLNVHSTSQISCKSHNPDHNWIV
jgi:hypothetical protein